MESCSLGARAITADLVCDKRMQGHHVMLMSILLFKELLMSRI